MHRIRQWMEDAPARRGSVQVVVPVFRWECWGKGCVTEGRPHRGKPSLTADEHQQQIKAHEEGQ